MEIFIASFEICSRFVYLKMLQEGTDGFFAFGRDSFTIQADLNVRFAIFLGLLDLEDPSGLSEHTENGKRSSDVGLHPFVVLDIVVFEPFDGADYEIEPSNVDDVPSLFFVVFWEQGFLDVLETGQK